jgi:hypothetical protein
MLYAEDRGLLPVDHPVYAAHYSVLALFEQLQNDAAAHPDKAAIAKGNVERARVKGRRERL